MSEWKPIETAPKDGTLILGIEQFEPILIKWETGGIDGGFWRDQDHYYYGKVTHWMPIPPSPFSGSRHAD